jgi:hypothetical protein
LEGSGTLQINEIEWTEVWIEEGDHTEGEEGDHTDGEEGDHHTDTMFLHDWHYLHWKK